MQIDLEKNIKIGKNVIKKNAWIGARAVILPGITVGENEEDVVNIIPAEGTDFSDGAEKEETGTNSDSNTGGKIFLCGTARIFLMRKQALEIRFIPFLLYYQV